MRRRVALLALLLVPAAGGATPTARIVFTQVNGAGTVVATYDADGSGGRALALGDSPSWSPDGTQVALAYRAVSADPADIAVVSADGSTLRKLTSDAGAGVSNTSPQWSPQDDWIAFLKTTRGIPQVWLVSPLGSGAHALTADSGQKSGLQWAPDGSKVLFLDDGGIYVSAPRGAPQRLTPSPGFDREPAWSPDGTRIAYTNGQLFVMNADGSNRHLVVSTFASQPLYAALPSWLPDGSRIAFVGTHVFTQYSTKFGPLTRQDVFTVASDGSDVRRLTGPPSDQSLYGYPSGGAPTWWPDGSRLFFQDARGGEGTTTLQMNPDGTCEGNFLPAGPRLIAPAWRPGSLPGLGRLSCVDLRIIGAAGNDAAAIGKPDELTFTIDNDGNQRATGVKVAFAPRGRTLLSTTSATVPSLEPHASADVHVDIRSYDANTLIGVTAIVTSDQPDSDPTTNQASVAAEVLPCTLVGTSGADYLSGTPGRDTICARPGADRIYALAGNDTIDAGNGDDVIFPGPGRDVVDAGGGNDTIYARDGQKDAIDCGPQHDIAVVDRFDVTRRCEVVARSQR